MPLLPFSLPLLFTSSQPPALSSFSPFFLSRPLLLFLASLSTPLSSRVQCCQLSSRRIFAKLSFKIGHIYGLIRTKFCVSSNSFTINKIKISCMTKEVRICHICGRVGYRICQLATLVMFSFLPLSNLGGEEKKIKFCHACSQQQQQQSFSRRKNLSPAEGEEDDSANLDSFFFLS